MRDEEEERRILITSAEPTVAIVASVSCRIDVQLASDVIGAIDFSESGELFATGGIARKIRVCSYHSLTCSRKEAGEDEEEEEEEQQRSSKRVRRRQLLDHEGSCVAMLCTPAKLSSVKWVPGERELLGCGDYDGVVSEWNVETGMAVTERHEHGGAPVWSVDYSSSSCFFAASAAGDGCVRLWSKEEEKSVGVIQSPRGNSMCCAQFNPAAPELLAVACADGYIYLYDLRKLQSAMAVVGKHDRAASYVRFMGRDKLVSASIDSTIKLWDIAAVSWVPICADPDLSPRRERSNCRLIRTFNSHLNARNFVGLSVLPDVGLVASGSETNDVFIYDTSAKDPVWRSPFPGSSVEAGSGFAAPDESFVAAVCWKQQADHYALVAANSEGIVQVIQARLVSS